MKNSGLCSYCKKIIYGCLNRKYVDHSKVTLLLSSEHTQTLKAKPPIWFCDMGPEIMMGHLCKSGW